MAGHIGDYRASAAGGNLNPLSKVRSNQILLGKRSLADIVQVQFPKNEEQQQLRKIITTNIDEGLKKAEQLGYGLFNGGGFFPPAPLSPTGTKALRLQVGKTTSFILGELLQTDSTKQGLDELSEDEEALISIPWLPVPVNLPGMFTNITSIPRNPITDTLTDSPLGTYIPANTSVDGGAASYRLDINAGIRVGKTLLDLELGTDKNVSDKLDGLGIFKSNQKEIYDFITSSKGVFLVDYTTKIPTLFKTHDPIDTSTKGGEEDSTSSGEGEGETSPRLAVADILESQEKWLGHLEKLLSLPLGQDIFRDKTYCKLQQLMNHCWSGNTIEDLTALLDGFELPFELDGILGGLNEWLPKVYQMGQALFSPPTPQDAEQQSDDSSQDPLPIPQSINIGDKTLDFASGSLSEDTYSQLQTFNETMPNSLKMFESENEFFVGSNVFTKGEPISSEQLQSIYDQSQGTLDTLSQWKVQKDFNGEIQQLLLNDKVVLDRDNGPSVQSNNFPGVPDVLTGFLQSFLPEEVSSIMTSALSERGIFGKDPNQQEGLESLQADDDGEGSNPLSGFSKQITEFLPEPLKEAFDFSDGSLKLDTKSLFSSAEGFINESMPSGFEMKSDFDENGNIKGLSLGPLAFDFTSGSLNISLDGLTDLIGGFDIIGFMDELPFDLGDLKSLITDVKYPLDEPKAGTTPPLLPDVEVSDTILSLGQDESPIGPVTPSLSNALGVDNLSQLNTLKSLEELTGISGLKDLANVGLTSGFGLGGLGLGGLTGLGGLEGLAGTVGTLSGLGDALSPITDVASTLASATGSVSNALSGGLSGIVGGTIGSALGGVTDTIGNVTNLAGDFSGLAGGFASDLTGSITTDLEGKLSTLAGLNFNIKTSELADPNKTIAANSILLQQTSTGIEGLSSDVNGRDLPEDTGRILPHHKASSDCQGGSPQVNPGNLPQNQSPDEQLNPADNLAQFTSQAPGGVINPDSKKQQSYLTSPDLPTPILDDELLDALSSIISRGEDGEPEQRGVVPTPTSPPPTLVIPINNIDFTPPDSDTSPASPSTKLPGILDNLGVPGAQDIIDQIKDLVNSTVPPSDNFTAPSLIPVINTLYAIASTPTKLLLRPLFSVFDFPAPTYTDDFLQRCTLSEFEQLDSIVNQEDLNDFIVDFLGGKPIDLPRALSSLRYFVDWLISNDRMIKDVVEELLRGNLYEFIAALIKYKTRFDVSTNPDFANRLRRLTRSTFGLPPQGDDSGTPLRSYRPPTLSQNAGVILARTRSPRVNFKAKRADNVIYAVASRPRVSINVVHLPVLKIQIDADFSNSPAQTDLTLEAAVEIDINADFSNSPASMFSELVEVDQTGTLTADTSSSSSSVTVDAFVASLDAGEDYYWLIEANGPTCLISDATSSTNDIAWTIVNADAIGNNGLGEPYVYLTDETTISPTLHFRSGAPRVDIILRLYHSSAPAIYSDKIVATSPFSRYTLDSTLTLTQTYDSNYTVIGPLSPFLPDDTLSNPLDSVQVLENLTFTWNPPSVTAQLSYYIVQMYDPSQGWVDIAVTEVARVQVGRSDVYLATQDYEHIAAYDGEADETSGLIVSVSDWNPTQAFRIKTYYANTFSVSTPLYLPFRRGLVHSLNTLSITSSVSYTPIDLT